MLFTENFVIVPQSVGTGMQNVQLVFDGQAANGINTTRVQVTNHLPNSADVRWLPSPNVVVAQNGKELIINKDFSDVKQTFVTSAYIDAGPGLIPGDTIRIGMVAVDLTDKTQELEFTKLTII